jgi:kynurenine formamidase
MPVFPGDELPSLTQIATVQEQGFSDHCLSTGMHVGTHIDAPAHMLENGKLISDYPAEKFFGRGVLIDARGKTFADVDLLSSVNIQKGDVVVVMFGWSEKFSQADYFINYPEITESFANKLVELGASIVGMDTPSPDSMPYKAHKILLAKDILIIENLRNLEALLNYKSFEITALPLNIEANASLCRIVAKINNYE